MCGFYVCVWWEWIGINYYYVVFKFDFVCVDFFCVGWWRLFICGVILIVMLGVGYVFVDDFFFV